MKPEVLNEPQKGLDRFESDIYAAFAGQHPVIVASPPRRQHHEVVREWISQRFPVAHQIAVKRFEEGRARCARCLERSVH